MTQQALPIRQIYKGETIFRQGAKADHMYIIREGKVDISLSRDDKTLHLSTLEKGAFFGEMALISDSPRSATATALEFCELYVIDSKAVEGILEKSNPIVRHMLKVMVSLVKEQNSGAGRGASQTPRLVGYAHLIEVLAAAGPAGASGTAGSAGTTGGANAGGAGTADAAPAAQAPEAQEVRVPERAVVDRAAVFFGDSRPAAMATLRFMDSVNLVRLDGGFVRTQARTLVERAQRLPPAVTRGLDDTVTMEQELMELADVEAVTKVDRAELLQCLALLDNLDDVLAFRRSALMRTLQDKGRDFFTSF